MRLIHKGVFSLVLVLLSACASYRPQPLTQAAVQARLKHPDMAELRILASEIKHPILHPVALNPEEGLSPDGAAVLAVLLNPALRALRDQKAVANAQLLEAGLLPNPELSYSLDLPTGNRAGRGNAFGLGLNWNVSALISRAARRGSAREHDAAIALDIAWQEWQVAQGAKSAVYRLVSLQAQEALAEQSAQHLATTLTRLQHAVAAGSLTSSTLRPAQAAWRQANATRLELSQKTAQQLLQLKRLLGLPSTSKLHLQQEISLPSRIELPAETALLKDLEQRRLDLLALRRGYASQEAAVHAAILNQFPQISIGPTLSRDADNLRTTGFSLNLSLPIFNRNQGQIALERATRQRLLDEYTNRVFEAGSDIGLLLSGIHFINEQITQAQADATDLDCQRQLSRSALAAGLTDRVSADLIWNAHIRAQMKMFALRGDLAQALVALQLASGFYAIPLAATPPTGAAPSWINEGKAL
ncbi:TolC family protein [Geopsychrobacter electrodiphilus]|uniref:TolC family protein n=1 Tax=Geopsychrobacter electrodiphilus TaxID=225196 RepID=UPI00146AFC46|nr:TolC family protein [Geopsychrobacter electrodiphilus]